MTELAQDTLGINPGQDTIDLTNGIPQSTDPPAGMIGVFGDSPWEVDQQAHEVEMGKWRGDLFGKIDSAIEKPDEFFKDDTFDYTRTPQEGRMLAVNDMFIAAHIGSSDVPVDGLGRHLTRQRVALDLFGGRGADSEEAFNAEVVKEHEKRKQGRAIYDAIGENASNAAVIEHAEPSARSKAWPELRDKLRAMPGYDQAKEGDYYEAFYQYRKASREIMEPWAQQLSQVWGAMQQGGAGTTSEVLKEGLKHATGVGAVKAMASEAMKRDASATAFHIYYTIPEADRDSFMDALGVMARTFPKKERDTFFGNLAKQGGRDVDALGRGAFEAFMANSISSLGAMPLTVTTPGAGNMRMMNQAQADAARNEFMARRNFAADVRIIEQADFSPIKSAFGGGTPGAIESGIYGIPGALASTAEAAIPHVGTWLTYLSMQGQTYDDLRNQLRSSGMSNADASTFADKWAPIVAAPLAALEKVEAGAWAGKIPGVQKAMDAAGDMIRNRAMRLGARTLISGTAETVTETVQDGMIDAAQDIGHALDEHVPDVKWTGENGALGGLWSQTGATFVSMLPLAIIGAAGGVSADARARAFAEAGSLRRQALGITAEHDARIEAAAAKGQSSLNRAVEDALAARDPYSDTAKKAVADMENEQATAEAMAEAGKASGILPGFRVNSDKTITVFDTGTGDEIGTAPDHTTAVRMATAEMAIREEHQSSVVAHLGGMLEAMQSRANDGEDGHAVDFEYHPFKKVSAAEKIAESPESTARVWKQLGITEAMDATTRDRMLSESFVHGFSETEFRDGILSTTNRILGTGSITTVFHEDVHGLRRVAMQRGKFTRDEQVASLRAIDSAMAKAGGRNAAKRFLSESKADADVTEEELDEAFSELMESEVLRAGVIGSTSAVGNKTAGIISRYFEAAYQASPLARAALSKLRGMARYLRAQYGQVFGRAVAIQRAINKGEINADEYEAMLNKLMGTDEVAQADQHAAIVAREIVDGVERVTYADGSEVDMPFSLGSLDPNAPGDRLVGVNPNKNNGPGVSTGAGNQELATLSGIIANGGRKVDGEWFVNYNLHNISTAEHPNPTIDQTWQQIQAAIKAIGLYYEADKSTKSGSKYVSVNIADKEADAEWFKIRISDHLLPDSYTNDADIFVGNSIAGNSTELGGQAHHWTTAIKQLAEKTSSEIPPHVKSVLTRISKDDSIKVATYKLRTIQQEQATAAARDSDAAAKEKGAQANPELAAKAAKLQSLLDEQVTHTFFGTSNKLKGEERKKIAYELSKTNKRLIEIGASELPENSTSYSISHGKQLDALVARTLALKDDPHQRAAWMARTARNLEKLRRDQDKIKTAFGKDYTERALTDERTRTSIAKEAAMRQALRRQELEDQAYAKHQAVLEQPELRQLKSQPAHELLADPFNPLRGLIMSRGEDVKSGKYNPAEHGDYDGADGVNPTVFGGTFMPDRAAQELYDAGLIKEPTADAMWDVLRKEQASVKKMREYMKAARSELTHARKTARDEAKAWQEAEIKRQGLDHSLHAKIIRAFGMLDGILYALPPDIRGKVGLHTAALAKLKSDEKRLEYLEKTIDRAEGVVEKWLVKEYGDMWVKLLAREKVKKNVAGKRPKGKAGADVHAIFANVRRATAWSGAEANAHVAKLEAELNDASNPPTAEREAALLQEIGIIPLVADWKNADSSRRAAAFESADRILREGMAEFTAAKLRERERRAKTRETLQGQTGKTGEAPERDAAMLAREGLKTGWKKYLWGLGSFEQNMHRIFGEDSAEAQRLVDMQREADFQKQDEAQAEGEGIEDLFTTLAGGDALEGSRLHWRLSRADKAVMGRTLSEMQMISVTLMWRQEDGRRHMIGHKDENGNPSGKWHYGQDFVDACEAALSNEAKAVRSYLVDKYAAEWAALNPIFRKLYGIDLPRHANYSPLSVQPVLSKGDMADPVTGQAVLSKGGTPSSLRTRAQGAIAEPDFKDAAALYMAHVKQLAHWKAYAGFQAEFAALIGHLDTRNTIAAAGGTDATMAMSKWQVYFTDGGFNDAAASLALFQGVASMADNAAGIALVGRIGVLAVQSTQLGAAIAEMPTAAYASRLARLMGGQLGWADAIRSPYIQRRLKQMLPVVRMAMEGLAAAKPNRIKHEVAKLGQLISGADALFTAGTYAIIYDYQLTQARKNGASEAEAVEIATKAAERSTDRVAQPTRPGARSLAEVTTAENPYSRLAWAFASESRQKLALAIFTAANPKASAARKARAFTVAWLIGGMGSTLIRTIWRDMKEDDDEELFDSRNWGWERLLLQAITGPLNGVPIIGDMIEAGAFAATGEYLPEGNLLSYVPRAAGTFRRLPGYFTGKNDLEDAMKDAETVLSGFGVFSRSIGAAASLSHLARDLYGASKNAID